MDQERCRAAFSNGWHRCAYGTRIPAQGIGWFTDTGGGAGQSDPFHPGYPGRQGFFQLDCGHPFDTAGIPARRLFGIRTRKAAGGLVKGGEVQPLYYRALLCPP